ncbi:LPS assembly lipoprotein LptE [Luteimonas sp. BDR2-5]|uniref:LPS-assembly lipoprotein LptE n=1 Tax=Proluteimonas luteida TaxID=2878685 RepID=UPI001E3A4A54|nr:LPS assembly lipoprotein LptE [Luteimonas sp. BDR2-5]MCD9028087.1 LPS assembly lipoprotein LptE [Luteimonas sp. BDR2-5]
MSRFRPVPFRLAAVVLVLALSACGFHLRNALTVPPDLGPVKVQARDPYSGLAQALNRALVGAGVERAEASRRDVATLQIHSERWASTPISIDARGRAQEYTLRYAVVFSMRDADGNDVVPQQAVELARDYLSIPTQAIGTDSERDLLAREMEREMTASIIRRIDAVFRNPQLRANE